MKMITKQCSLLLLATCMYPVISFAQDPIVLNGQDDAYRQAFSPRLLSNYQNSTIFADGKNVWNLRGGKMLSVKGNIGGLAVSPSGDCYAAHRTGDKSVGVYDLWKKKKRVGIAKMTAPVACYCFSSDGSQLFVVDEKGQMGMFRSTDFKQMNIIQLPSAATSIAAAGNGQSIAATDGREVMVVSTVDGSVLANLTAGSSVTSMSFSADSKDLAVLLSDGILTVYDTRTFLVKKQVKAMGDALDCAFHPSGKYVAVITGDSRISIVNMVDENDRKYVDCDESGISEILFAKDDRGGIYLVYNTGSAVHYKLVNELPPYYSKLLEEEVTKLMDEWEVRMPEETMEAYQIRVNDETRAAQQRLFEEAVATRMAEDLMRTDDMQFTSADNMSFSSYNPETGMMTLDFEQLPPIYFNVPKEEVGYFTNPNDVELLNPIYAIGENDQFELVYADVYNKKTGKTYVFNNRERNSLDYLANDNRFIPLEFVAQGNMEEMKLDELKNQMVTDAMQQKSISDHTKIKVSTNTISDTGVNGEKIVNYQVSFNYQVEQGFTEKEDFAPGRYVAAQSAAARTMLNIITKALQTDFAQYMKEGKAVVVKITGSADASPVKRIIPYKGEYGDFEEALVCHNNVDTLITVTKKSGISSNEQLAFLRAMGMKDGIIKNVKQLSKMDAKYDTFIEQGEGIGGEFRRIRVDFLFKDAF